MINEQKTSIWERLRMAYKALTQDYYVFFGFDEDSIVWNEDGSYKEINNKKISQFSYIPHDMKMSAYNIKTNLHDFLWGVIEKFAKEAQNGKF